MKKQNSERARGFRCKENLTAPGLFFDAQRYWSFGQEGEVLENSGGSEAFTSNYEKWTEEK